MAYSTVVEVRNALAPAPPDSGWDDGAQPDNSYLTGTAADLPNEQIEDAIAEADSTIDSYIGANYIVPVINDITGTPYPMTPHPLDYWSRNIAAYNATLSYRGNQDVTLTDPVSLRYTKTMADLVKVQSGLIVLSIPPTLATATSAGQAGQVLNTQPPVGLACGLDIYGPSWPIGSPVFW